MGSYLEIARRVAYELKHPEERKKIEAEKVREALVCLKTGETAAIRLYSETLKGEFLIVADEDTLKGLEGFINVDIPSFTLKELKELLGADKEMVEKVYLVKKAFKGSKVVSQKKKTVAVTEVIKNA